MGKSGQYKDQEECAGMKYGYFDDKKEIVRKQARTGLSVMAVPVVCMVVSELVGYIVYIFTAKPGETFFGWSCMLSVLWELLRQYFL